jgi:hypothetical protein
LLLRVRRMSVRVSAADDNEMSGSFQILPA